MSFTLTINTYDSANCKLILRQDERGESIGAYKYITGNCQLFSFSTFYVLLNWTDKKEAIDVIYQNINKYIAVIDINSAKADQVDELFDPECILGKNPYTSSNGSSMVLYLVNLKRQIAAWKARNEIKQINLTVAKK